VQVRDNGPGIPPSQRDRVFDPFFTTRAPGEGTGLGLSIAFDIVREHGGALELGDAPEGGACFTIRLPAA
jgi:two-component system sensor histidine kinase HupT/HoxJ